MLKKYTTVLYLLNVLIILYCFSMSFILDYVNFIICENQDVKKVYYCTVSSKCTYNTLLFFNEFYTRLRKF